VAYAPAVAWLLLVLARRFGDSDRPSVAYSLERVTEQALLGLALEQGCVHKTILLWLATLGDRKVIAVVAARALGAGRCGAEACGGPRGQFARRRRRGPEGLRAAGGAQARDVPPKGPPDDRRRAAAASESTTSFARLLPTVASRPRRARAPLMLVKKLLTPRRTGTAHRHPRTSARERGLRTGLRSVRA